MRERSLMCSRKELYCICSYTSYITNLYVDVGKLPNHLKICVLYLYALDQFWLCFIIKISLQWTENHHGQGFICGSIIVTF